MIAQKNPVAIESAEAWTLKSASGTEYLIQIGFPRDWLHPGPDAPSIDDPVPILYLCDGNGLFLTALEAMHRRLAFRDVFMANGVVVAIDYPVSPISPHLWNPRRGRDLTPPTADSNDTEGGADEFLDFIADRVMPHVHRRLKETRGASPGREALYGHSYGGLFTLHALFKRPELFDCFIASSPSIWYKDRCILQEEEEFRTRSKRASATGENDEKVGSEKKPSLMLFSGDQEEVPPRRRGESDEEYEEKRKRHGERRMVSNMREMHQRLADSGLFKHLAAQVYEGEDHGTIMACTVSRGASIFFENWPYANVV